MALCSKCPEKGVDFPPCSEFQACEMWHPAMRNWISRWPCFTSGWSAASQPKLIRDCNSRGGEKVSVSIYKISFHLPCSKNSAIIPILNSPFFIFWTESSQTNPKIKLFPGPKKPRAICHNLSQSSYIDRKAIWFSSINLPIPQFHCQLGSRSSWTVINPYSWTNLQGKEKNRPYSLQVLAPQALRVWYISQCWAWALLRKQLNFCPSSGNVDSSVGVFTSTLKDWADLWMQCCIKKN